MLFRVLVQVVLARILIVQGVCVNPSRVKRGIFGTVTSTVYKTVEEKRYVPSSCVHVSPNLPDCRIARFMNYPNFDPNSFKFFNIGNELFPSTSPKEGGNNVNPAGITKRVGNVEPTTTHIQGWGEYLGFYRPTITVTELKIVPTTVLDPRIMVTYDIRGCKPHELPFNLEKCVEDNSLELAEILPTSTVLGEIKPTKIPEKMTIVADDLHGSETHTNHEIVPRATETL